MANRKNGTIYIGVTSDLGKRIWEHRNGAVAGLTKRYGCKLLVWYEAFDEIQQARHRELQMKEWKRVWKIKLIEEKNLGAIFIRRCFERACARPEPRPAPGNSSCCHLATKTPRSRIWRPLTRFGPAHYPSGHELRRRIFRSCIDRCRVAAVAALELDFRGRRRVAMA